MTRTTRPPRDEWAARAVVMICCVLGLACITAGLVGRRPLPGVIVGLAFGLLALAVRRPIGGETGAVIAGGDVRQQQIDVLAMAVSDMVLTVGLTSWLIVELATDGHPWPPTALLLISATTYVAAIEVLRRRR